MGPSGSDMQHQTITTAAVPTMAVPRRPAQPSVALARGGGTYPPNVGIVAMDIYFPRRCLDQTELEKHDGVSPGKYTIGLGQQMMAFCDDREDINSISLTVVEQLMTKYQVAYNDVGRLEVGTETLIDKSKSVKTHLMDLFARHGNTHIEGISTTNACYGGTSALFNAVQWVESSYWDGRYAIVVAADIAVYASGPARPTSGAGAIAMLIGPNAPLVMERGLRGTHMENVYDFYKPDLRSEFPVVDGPQSVVCYMRAVDKCYAAYTAALAAQTTAASGGGGSTGNNTNGHGNHHAAAAAAAAPLTDQIDYAVFHAPYAKIVQKAAGRLFLNDAYRYPQVPQFAIVPERVRSVVGGAMNGRGDAGDKEGSASASASASYLDKDVEKASVDLSRAFYGARTEPSLLACKQIGNMYCASLYGSLLSLLTVTADHELQGKRILLFSYGSGLASSMFSFRVVGSVKGIVQQTDLLGRLKQRTVLPPPFFEQLMQLREREHNASNYTPQGDVTNGLWPGTYYLTNIDPQYRRTYARSSPTVA